MTGLDHDIGGVGNQKIECSIIHGENFIKVEKEEDRFLFIW